MSKKHFQSHIIEEISMDGLNLKDVQNLPEILQSQISQLNSLDEKIKKASKAAGNAITAAENAKKCSVGIIFNSDSIEEIQKALLPLAESVQLGAEAQTVSFEFQKDLAKVCKSLLGLGVSNIAMNRVVVRELELRLQGASEQEISELAKNEILSVVRQLKAQEDSHIKQERTEAAIKELLGRLNEYNREREKIAVQINEFFITTSQLRNLFAAEKEQRLNELSVVQSKEIQLQEKLISISKDLETLKRNSKFKWLSIAKLMILTVLIIFVIKMFNL